MDITIICLDVMHEHTDTAGEHNGQEMRKAEQEKSLESIINLADIDLAARYTATFVSKLNRLCHCLTGV